MRRLSIVRVTFVGLGSLALVTLMLLGAMGVLPEGKETHPRIAHVSIADGKLPVTELGDSPSSAEDLLSPGASPRLDLEGDEVSPALAAYGIDRDGNLFEVHSPHTEEPRLGSPIG